MAETIDTACKQMNHRGQIDIIEMTMDETCDYKYFFVYEDQHSKFVVLQALRNNTAKEVAKKLLDILTIIGPPQVLQSGNGRTFAEQVVREIRSLWKDIIILHGEIFKHQETTRDFKNLLKHWLNDNPTKAWYDGLKFIQVFQNSTFHDQDDKIPCDILFGRNVHKEFQNLIVPKDLSNDMWTEEQWFHENQKQITEELNNDVKERRKHLLSEHTNTNGDYITEGDESGQDLCESSKDITHVNGFDFVNVKSDIPVHASQIEDTVFEEEPKYNIALNTNEENLKCQICQKQYMKLGHLKNHMQTHAKGENLKCNACNKIFRISSLYEKHMRQYHDRVNTRHAKQEKCRRNSIISRIKYEQEESLDKESLESSDCTMRLSGQDDALSNTTRKYTKIVKDLIVTRSSSCKVSKVTKLNDNGSLECKYCKQKFNFPSVLKRHIRSHTNERPYICEICSKSFKQLGHLSQHSLTHKDYRSFLCSTCGIKFTSLDALKIHSRSHKDEFSTKSKETYRLFECDSCKKVFTTKSVLERHIFTHTHERQFGCKICGKRFKQAGHVKSHMLVHTGERKFQCNICSKRFSLANSLKKHMYVHNGEKPHQCDVCGARFLERRNLNGHLMTHTNERPFSCKICGKRYTLADTLRRHISAAHEDGRTYQCEICAKMFKQLAHLSVHKKVHNDERPFQCHLCEKNFKHKNVLKSHLAIHANVRPFECDECKATFVRKTNLQTHIASAHMNERPYICTICGKRFKQISHLNGHVVVHSNLMPYQCDFCDRRCNRLDNLKKHMRLHTKNKEQNVT